MPNEMMKLAYDSTAVGATKIITKAPTETFSAFQDVFAAAKVLSDEHKIKIEHAHTESQTGKKHVDSFKFVRLR